MEENSGELIKSHIFEGIVLEKPVTFCVMKMKDCLFLWIGDSGNLDSLAVAMKTAFNPYPTACSLTGSLADEGSSSISSKLSNKTGKQVFASYNISQSDNRMIIFIIERLVEELSLNPDKF